jgi:hypothetical protein
MASRSNSRAIARLESDLNYYKREKEVMEQQFANKRQQILDQIRIPSSDKPEDRARDMVISITNLNLEYRRECEKIDGKINTVKQELNRQKLGN